MKNIIKVIIDIIEIYLPAFLFLVLFGAFLLQIFCRYVLNSPLTFTYEITIVAYTWIAVLTAGYARRTNENVVFSIIYDKVSEKSKIIFRILGNLIVAITYIILIYPAYQSIQFLSFIKTTYFQISQNIVFFPFIIFLILIIFYSCMDIYKDIKILRKEK